MLDGRRDVAENDARVIVSWNDVLGGPAQYRSRRGTESPESLSMNLQSLSYSHKAGSPLGDQISQAR